MLHVSGQVLHSTALHKSTRGHATIAVADLLHPEHCQASVLRSLTELPNAEPTRVSLLADWKASSRAPAWEQLTANVADSSSRVEDLS